MKIQRSTILLWMMLLMMPLSLLAQTNEGNKNESDDPFEETWKDRIVFGGNIFPGYSNGWILDLTPMVGYKLTQTTIAGVGVNYYYRSFRSPIDNYRQIWRSYGGRAFVMQDLMYGLFGQAEYEFTYANYREKSPTDELLYEANGSSPGLLLGGGYSQRSGSIGYNITVLYDVFYGRNSINRNSPLVIRGGLIFGL